MDNLTQWAIGGSLYTLITGKHSTKQFLLGAVIANVGDFDVFVWPLLPLGDLESFFFHRGIMHSVLFAVVSSALISYFLYRADKSVAYWRYLLACLVAMFGGHLLIDAMTTYGMRFWLPRSNYTVSTDNIFIVDFGMWIITIGGFITYLSRKSSAFKKRVAWRILGLSAAYFGMSFGLQYHADQVMWAQAPDYIWSGAVHKTIAQPLQPFLRKQVIKDTAYYENAGPYHIAYYSIFDKSENIERYTLSQSDEGVVALSRRVDSDPTLTKHYNLINDFARWYLRVTLSQSGFLLENMLNGPIIGRTGDERSGSSFDFQLNTTDKQNFFFERVSGARLEISRDTWRQFWKRVRWH